MIYSAVAERQIDALCRHYASLDRSEALGNLLAALTNAEAAIEADPAAGLKAPRPYPVIIRLGRLWLKAGRYWIAYAAGPPPVILAVFFDAANIPGRV